MSVESTNHLLEEVSNLTRQRDVLVEQVAQVREHLHCSKTDPNLPLQHHGQAQICGACYDALRSNLARVSVVVGSIRAVVQVWMQQGRECPFCHETKRHTETCYLIGTAGDDLLAEYRAIEQHRDLLLAEQEREHPTAHSNGEVRSRLKNRLHAHDTNGVHHAVDGG